MDFPSAFVRRITELLGPERARQLLHALDEPPVVSLRRNPWKHARPAGLGDLASEPVPWCATGRYLPERPAFTRDPLLHAGAYYVQEASSMFIERAWLAMQAQGGLAERPLLLDLCAAPGGKSTLWRTLLPEQALLVSNEPDRRRAAVLAENLAKWGHTGQIVTSAYGKDFGRLASLFDVVATDVPCSGEGMFRKGPDARSEWSEAGVERCAALQREIVEQVWPALKPGGFLVYSTCTFSREEDEDCVRWICRHLGASPVPISTPEAWGICGEVLGPQPEATGQATGEAPGARRTASAPAEVHHFFPGRARGEGFFLALLRKDQAAPSGTPATTAQPLTASGRKAKVSARPLAAASAPLARLATLRWLPQGQDYEAVSTTGGTLCALRKSDLGVFRQLVAQRIHIVSAGTPLCELKGSGPRAKLVPRHELALSLALQGSEAFPRVELSESEALRYLRREALTLPPDTPRGPVLVCFRSLPLGFCNNLGTRANNLYPAEWRIRSQER